MGGVPVVVLNTKVRAAGRPKKNYKQAVAKVMVQRANYNAGQAPRAALAEKDVCKIKKQLRQISWADDRTRIPELGNRDGERIELGETCQVLPPSHNYMATCI